MTNYLGRWLVTGMVLLSFVWFLSGCTQKDTQLTREEGLAITEICSIDAGEFSDITTQVLNKSLAEKFPAVKKIAYNDEGLYAFILEPVAYNGPVTLALVIDEAINETVGLRVVRHDETYEFVRDMESKWFMDRFAQKPAAQYLRLVRLNTRADDEVVAITGATVTTEGVINGVNAAFGVYQEYILGQTAMEVPYKVLFEPGDELPIENSSLSIRAYGLILGEVPLEDIRKLPAVKRTMSIHSTAGITQHAFRGTLLSNVLELVDPALMEEYQWVLAVGVDSYLSGITMDEVKAENNVYVMYEDNDEPLPKKTGEPGALRVVVLDDFFGQRFTNYMLEIVLENEEPY